MAVTLELPSRYEVRVLELKDLDWASAIAIHSNIFFSPVWSVIHPNDQARLTYESFEAAKYLVQHQIESGLSLGVFDKEYEYRRPESAATGGKLYWDARDTDADGTKLLEQMDFPLVSVALALDSFKPLDMAKMADLLACLPMFGSVYTILAGGDKRDPAAWQATGPGQVIFRNATSTRHDYEGRGIMRGLAQYMMRTAAEKGFRGIQIETLSDGVAKVWLNPPAPFRGELVSSFRCDEYFTTTEAGEKVYGFSPSKQEGCKIYCHLK